jgi:hypothetical protein
MSSRLFTVLAFAALLCVGRAHADCDGGVDEKKRNYERALAFERQGDKDEALYAYVTRPVILSAIDTETNIGARCILCITMQDLAGLIHA